MADQKIVSGVALPPDGALNINLVQLSRRDLFIIHFGAAILTRGQGRTPGALAREVVPFVDAFIEVADGGAK